VGQGHAVVRGGAGPFARQVSNLATAYLALGQGNKALPLLEDTVAKMKAKFGTDHPATLRSLSKLALAHGAIGNWEKAVPLLEEAVQKNVLTLGPDHPETMASMENLALAYEQTKVLDKAEALWRGVLTSYRARLGPSGPHIARALSGLGGVLLLQKQYGNAEQVLRESVEILARLKSDGWGACHAQALLGATLSAQKKYADAESLLRDGYDGMKKRADQIPAWTKFRLAETAQQLVELYEGWERPEQAAQWRKVVEAERALLQAK
jgi:eukaryotic-like serine/threonine-protein kinase